MNQEQPKPFYRPTNKTRILGMSVAILFLIAGVVLLFFDLPAISLSERQSIPAGFGVMIIGFFAGAIIGNFPIIQEIREIIKNKTGNQTGSIPTHGTFKESQSGKDF